MSKLLITAVSLVAALAVVGIGSAKTSGPITVPDDLTVTIASGDTTVAYNWSASTTQPELDSLFRCLDDADSSVIGSRFGPGSFSGSLTLGPGTYNLTCYQYVADPTGVGGYRFVATLGWSVTVNLPTPIGQCNKGITPSYRPGAKADRNADDYVCIKGKSITDNNH